MQYEIQGTPFPVVICELKKGEKMVSDSGAMAWMDPCMKMETTSGGIGKAFGRMFSGETMFLNVYEALAIPGDENFARIDTQAAQQAINRIWVADGKSWSQRIWSNTELLKQTLNEQLLHCVVTGKKTTELKKLLQERFGVSYSRAATLVRTETCHIQTEAAKQRYENYGIQQYEFLADTDEKTCSVCGQLDGKRFYFTEMQPGVNAPPMHPNDRCAIIPVI